MKQTNKISKLLYGIKTDCPRDGSNHDIYADLTKLQSSLLKIVLEALPEKMDDRPEITEWLYSKDYTKGFNACVDDVRKRMEELFMVR